MKVGLDLGKCQNLARVGFFKMFFFVKISYAKYIRVSFIRCSFDFNAGVCFVQE
jgi:hypothetical protein